MNKSLALAVSLAVSLISTVRGQDPAPIGLSEQARSRLAPELLTLMGPGVAEKQPIPKAIGKTPEGQGVRLHQPRRLTVLVFGSHSCGPFSSHAPALQRAYERYKDRVDFWWVYVREAHAADSSWPARHVKIDQPTSTEERTKVAASCSVALQLEIPQLVDGIDDALADAFDAFPDRLYILSPDGTVAFRGDPGPRGFKVDVMLDRLQSLLEPSEGSTE